MKQIKIFEGNHTFGPFNIALGARLCWFKIRTKKWEYIFQFYRGKLEKGEGDLYGLRKVPFTKDSWLGFSRHTRINIQWEVSSYPVMEPPHNEP